MSIEDDSHNHPEGSALPNHSLHAGKEVEISIEADIDAPIGDPGDEDLALTIEEASNLPEHSLHRIISNVVTSTQTALATEQRMQPYVPMMMQLPGFDSRWARNLGVYARAVLRIHLIAQRRVASLAMLEEGVTLRRQMVTTGKALVTFGKVDEERIEAISMGIGRAELATALIEVAAIFREVWEEVEGTTPVTRAMVDRADELGYELHRRIGTGDWAGEGVPGSRLTPKALRRRAWTLLVDAYVECRRALAYLVPEEVDDIAPTIFPKSRTREAEEAEPGEGTEPTTSVTPTPKPEAGATS